MDIRRRRSPLYEQQRDLVDRLSSKQLYAIWELLPSDLRYRLSAFSTRHPGKDALGDAFVEEVDVESRSALPAQAHAGGLPIGAIITLLTTILPKDLIIAHHKLVDSQDDGTGGLSAGLDIKTSREDQATFRQRYEKAIADAKRDGMPLPVIKGVSVPPRTQEENVRFYNTQTRLAQEAIQRKAEAGMSSDKRAWLQQQGFGPRLPL